VRCTEDGVTRRVRATRAPAADAPRRWHVQAGGVDWWLVDESLTLWPAPDKLRQLRN
jgi:hypothetical protein